MVKIKVCGVTRVADAVLASELGVSAVGLVFWEQSPRSVEPEQAAAIVAALPSTVAAVGVFVNQEQAWVCDVIARVGLTGVQLHGEETEKYCRAMPVPVLKAVPMRTAADVEAALRLSKTVTPLIDVYDPVHRGGTGGTADWNTAAVVARRRQVFLAGGLEPRNVGQAIAAVCPYGVDVSSGLEAAPGIKDPGRLRAFVAAVGEARGNGRS